MRWAGELVTWASRLRLGVCWMGEEVSGGLIRWVSR